MHLHFIHFIFPVSVSSPCPTTLSVKRIPRLVCCHNYVSLALKILSKLKRSEGEEERGISNICIQVNFFLPSLCLFELWNLFDILSLKYSVLLRASWLPSPAICSSHRFPSQSWNIHLQKGLIFDVSILLSPISCALFHLSNRQIRQQYSVVTRKHFLFGKWPPRLRRFIQHSLGFVFVPSSIFYLAKLCKNFSSQVLFDRFIGYVHSYNASEDQLTTSGGKASPLSASVENSGQYLTSSTLGGPLTASGGSKSLTSTPLSPSFWDGVDNIEFVETLASQVHHLAFLFEKNEWCLMTSTIDVEFVPEGGEGRLWEIASIFKELSTVSIIGKIQESSFKMLPSFISWTY